MTILQTINDTAIEPALDLLPSRMDSAEARVMLLAIGLQESRFLHRKQIKGPARGFWQFERGGGVVGVLNHASTAHHANLICQARGVEPMSTDVYMALEKDDVLAAAFARLLLWTDPYPIPSEKDAAWALYERTWRPGRPHRSSWDAFFEQAQEFVIGGDL